MSLSDVVRDLPSRNVKNFTRFNPNSCNSLSAGKKTAYVPVRDIPSDQVIINEKVSILLGCLHKKGGQEGKCFISGNMATTRAVEKCEDRDSD